MWSMVNHSAVQSEIMMLDVGGYHFSIEIYLQKLSNSEFINSRLKESGKETSTCLEFSPSTG